MKLKSMTIVGFKSFANKTTINFEPGLTAIVGPNGSGKSNVIEAIRWVLGEQSAKNLRGTKMPDVIFSGSNHRHPLNRAEVSLTFDNSDHYLKSDYSEITITRRIFRDGQGAYFLNHSECRLKDINRLLVDSGIGKGSFSIISQGNVEEIFNSKPEQRRTIIETTAGIYKYRLQKQQAEQKLTTTNDNLSRVNDIIYELSDRVKSLKTQSEAAQKYLTLKKQLGRLKDTAMIYQLDHLKQRYAQSDLQLQRTLQAEKDDRTQIEQLSKQKKTGQQALNQLLSQNDQLQSKLLKTAHQVEQKVSQQQLATQKDEFRRQHLSQLNEEIDQLQAQLQTLNQRSTSVTQKYRSADGQLQRLNQQAANLEHDDLNHKIGEMNQRIRQLQDRHFELTQQLSQVDQQVQLKHQSRQQAQVHFNELQTALKQARQRWQAQNDQMEALKQKRAESENQGRDWQVQFDQYERQRQSLSQQVNQLQSQWYDSLQKYQQRASQVKALQRMLDNHVGFYHGSQNLLNAHLDGVVGAVVDFVQVDGQYEQAIEVALGSRLQQVITENKPTAQRAINYLKQHRLGRVTLLPKDNLSTHRINDGILVRLKGDKGFIGTADRLVQMPNALSQVQSYLLGNVLVVEDMQAAFRISDQVQHRFKVVTLTGEVVNAGGSVTGGANKNAGNGILSQQNELNAQIKQQQQLHQKAQGLETQLRATKAQLGNVQTNLESLNPKLSPIQKQLAQIDGQLDNLKQQMTTTQQQVTSIKFQIKEEAPKQFQSVDDQNRQSIKAAIEQNQAQIDHLNQSIQAFTDAQADSNQSAQKLRQQLDAQQQVLNDYKVDLRGIQLQIDESAKRLDDLQRQKLSLAHHAGDDQTIDLKQLAASIEKMHHQIDQWQVEINANKQQISQLQASQPPLEQKIEQCQQSLLKHQRQLDQLRSDTTRLNNQIDQLQTTLNEQPTPIQIDPKSIDINHVQNQIDNLNQQVFSIGTVNINSIDEYQSVNERYQFLTGQADDLKQSKHQLTQTMDRMDQTVKQRFKKTFDDLQMAFKTTFVSIFGGGDAKLTLDDPHHLLTTGIEIMAQPPGKKYRNMSLLSGGERALTAIALLFAILRLHPVPFCILDEAESALDSANVDRFARYISKFKDQTQFIVITHRKETMVYADQLYGITMQNSGISEMIDVNLKQIQQTEDS